ncbi:single-stranded DNA-binding protein [Patescibacteria group bacterium]
MNFNKAIIVGRLTRDPETKALPSGQSLASFSMATNRVWNDANGNKQEATEFHNIVAFGKLADICSKYLSKGRLVLIEGRIQTRSWQDQNGNKRYRTEIIADNMQMGPRSDSSASTNNDRSSNYSQNQTPQSPIKQEDIPVIEAEPSYTSEKTSVSTDEDEKDEINVKDIPF